MPKPYQDRGRFQSAPLTKARGDECLGVGIDPRKAVSIRSPHKSKGRRCYPNQRAGTLSFNPLPSQKQGETPGDGRSGSTASVSIRSPHKSKGRHESSLPPPRLLQFQSAPLTKARGDILMFTFDLTRLRFQSAPLTKARGDRRYIENSPDHRKFQSAPLTKARGDRMAAPDSGPYGRFNPLPSQKQGETPKSSRRAQAGCVSIRSPHKSKGRRSVMRGVSQTTKFQSAPLTKARGDALL